MNINQEKNMKKVTVYDINSTILKDSKGEYNTLPKKFAILEGPKGIVVTDDEAVHRVLKSDEEKIPFNLYKTLSEGFSLIPDKKVETSIKSIKENCISEEAELSKYVRFFGTRIKCNYAILLKSIKKIGLKSKDYSME